MKHITTIVVTALAVLSQAQTWNDIPFCPRACLQYAVRQHTNCGTESTDDFACLCQHLSHLQVERAFCIYRTCGQTGFHSTTPLVCIQARTRTDLTDTGVMPVIRELCQKAGIPDSTVNTTAIMSRPAGVSS